MHDIGFVVAVKNIAEILKGMWEFCCNVIEVIANPIEMIIIPVIDMSYWVLLITAMVCLILTIVGCKKTKNGAMISTIIYIILQCIRAVLITV